MNFGRLMKGVLHSKFWIVDRKHVFIGSANMDWRALTQVTPNICNSRCLFLKLKTLPDNFNNLLLPAGEGTGSSYLQLFQSSKGPAEGFQVLLGDGTNQQLPATALACRV